MEERQNITDPFDTPFSEIGDHLGTQFSPSVVGIGGRAYLLDTLSGDYWRAGVDVLKQRNTTNNRDLLLMPQDVWRYMFESWHQGAGQSNLDRDDSLPFRYYQSYGIDPWTKYEISLLHRTEQAYVAPDNVPMFLAVHNDMLVMSHGTTVAWYQPAPAVPQVIEVPVGTAPIIDTTYDGDGVYTLHADGSVYHSLDPQTTVEKVFTFPTMEKPADAPDDWTPPPDPDRTKATFIAYVKDYLIIGIGNQLFDITGPVARLIYTSPVTGFTWRGATEGNVAIYAVGGASDKHVIHRIGVKNDGTGLTPAIVAATLPDGEVALSVGSYLGFVFIGTDTGVRMATPTGDGDLILGALVNVGTPVLGFEGQDRFIWFTNSAVQSEFGQGQEEFPLGTVCGLTRLDLTSFTVTESTPAYANDIVAEGVHAHTVRNVVTWRHGRAFTIDGVGLFIESSTRLMSAGWITHGAISFGVEDLKTGLYAQFKWLPLEGGSVEMLMAYDSKRYTSLAERSDAQSIRSGNISFNRQQFSRVNVGIILRADKETFTKGPHVTRWEIRAVPVQGVASRWSLPIINHDEIDLAGVKENRDVVAELQRLLKIVQSGNVLTLQEGGISYSVYPKDYKWTPQKLASNGRGWQGVFQLIVEEIK